MELVVPVPEVARSAVVTATTLLLESDDLPQLLAVDGWCADGRGDLLLAVPEDSPWVVAAPEEPPVQARLRDAAPLPVRDRVRSTVQLLGWLQPACEAVDAWSAACGGARPAPGSRVLQHLVAEHAEHLEAVLTTLPQALRAPAARIVPLRLHRRALVLRIEAPAGDVDLALGLPRRRRAPLPSTPQEVLGGLRALLRECCGDC